jgi:hypothetical protein
VQEAHDPQHLPVQAGQGFSARSGYCFWWIFMIDKSCFSSFSSEVFCETKSIKFLNFFRFRKASLRPQAVRFWWSDQARVPQEGLFLNPSRLDVIWQMLRE